MGPKARRFALGGALLRRHGRVFRYANYAGGGLLILLGIAVFTNLLPVLVKYLPLNAPRA